MERDRYGLALSTGSAEAAAAYREGLDLMLAAYPGAEACFEKALHHDEGFALAHAGLARQHQIYSRMPQAKEAIARAKTLSNGVTAREAAHIAILGLLLDGQPAKALEALLKHMEEFPRDALPLSLALGAFGLYAFSGRADHDDARLVLCRSLAPHYGEDWWFLTHLGWAHTEAGELDQGGRIAQRSLELRRENAHGAHAYAHFFTEAGERQDGARFVEDWLPGYDPGALLYAHITWHRALWRLEQDDVDGALQLYAAVLRPAVNHAPPINVISDAASLLWRISLNQATAHWEEVHEYAKKRYPGPAPHFIEWHLAMAAAGAGDLEGLERRLASLPELPPGAVFGQVCAALAAYSRKHYRKVVELLEPVTQDFARLGGSGAQRAVLHQTLQAARARAKS